MGRPPGPSSHAQSAVFEDKVESAKSWVPGPNRYVPFHKNNPKRMIVRGNYHILQHPCSHNRCHILELLALKHLELDIVECWRRVVYYLLWPQRTDTNDLGNISSNMRSSAPTPFSQPQGSRVVYPRDIARDLLFPKPQLRQYTDVKARLCDIPAGVLTRSRDHSNIHFQNTHCEHSGVHHHEDFALGPTPNPSLVFLMTAVIGASKPPDNPTAAPSDQPIDASIMNPTFVSPIFGAA